MVRGDCGNGNVIRGTGCEKPEVSSILIKLEHLDGGRSDRASSLRWHASSFPNSKVNFIFKRK